MKAIEVWRNGERLMTAGLERGTISATLIICGDNKVPDWFNLAGRNRDTGGHTTGLHELVAIGDEFFLKVVDVETSDLQESNPETLH